PGAGVGPDDLVAGPRRGVRDVDADRDGVAGGVEEALVDAEVIDRELRVRPPVAERPEWRRRPAYVVDLPVRLAAGRVVPIRQRDLADVARDRDGQPPARIDVDGKALRAR